MAARKRACENTGGCCHGEGSLPKTDKASVEAGGVGKLGPLASANFRVAFCVCWRFLAGFWGLGFGVWGLSLCLPGLPASAGLHILASQLQQRAYMYRYCIA